MLKLTRKYNLKDFQYLVFIICVIAIPFTKEYQPYVMFLWVTSGVFVVKKSKNLNYRSLILLMMPLIVYVMHVFGLLYSKNFNKGIFNIEVRLSLLFIPLIAVFLTDKVKQRYILLFKLFVGANLLASLICLFIAFFYSFSINKFGILIFEPSYWPELKDLNFIQLINERGSFFSYDMLSVFHHPSYFSIYILFSIVLVIYLIRVRKGHKVFFYVLVTYFTIFLWLLGSRAAYLTYLIGFIIFIVDLILKYKKYWISLLLILLGVTLSIIVFSNKKLKQNVRDSMQLAEGEGLNQNSDMRLWLWKSGIEVFKENFWFGVGTGDIDAELEKKYEKYDLKLASEHNYNVHNQFLDIAIKFGIFGLIIFTSWMVYALMISIKRKQFLFFFFLLIMFVNFFFEVMLNSIAGVSFFAFFYSLLYAKYNITQELHVNKKT